MEELTRQVVAVEELLGRELVERLRDAPGWRERFALLDSRAAATGRGRSCAGARGGLELRAAGGRRRPLGAGALAEEVGWSRRHLAARWRRDVGMGPKAVARVLRFQRALRLLRDGARSPTWPTTAASPTSPTSTASSARSAAAHPGEVTNLQDAAATPV
jgi:AraC-like DNA-binding protein